MVEKMKFKIILIAVLISANSVFAQSKFNDDVKALKSELVKKSLSSEEIDAAYDKLSDLVNAKTQSLSMKELLEMCLQYTKHDPSDAPYELVYDLKKSNSSEFNKALNKLPKKDKDRIIGIIKIQEDTEKFGNG